MIVFIPHGAAGCKPGRGESEWLPRWCPACREWAIIGHGRRLRQAHDETHDHMVVRRGMCKRCRRTVTVLPEGCIPGARYSLGARQSALAAVAAGVDTQAAAPHCRDANRVADAATIRRWFWRRIQSWRFWRAPTMLAWDWRAMSRILMAEISSP